MSSCEVTWMYIKRGFSLLLLDHNLLEKYSCVKPHTLITLRGCDFTIWLVLYCNELKLPVEVLKFNGVALEDGGKSKVLEA